jgi:hypothetical protein
MRFSEMAKYLSEGWMAAAGFAFSGLIRFMGEARAALLRRLALGFLIASPWDFIKLSSATPFIKLL